MKELQVLTGPLGDARSCIVTLRNVDRAARLTPRLARRAARVANGAGYNVTVFDRRARQGYRVYQRSARRLDMDA